MKQRKRQDKDEDPQNKNGMVENNMCTFEEKRFWILCPLSHGHMFVESHL